MRLQTFLLVLLLSMAMGEGARAQRDQLAEIWAALQRGDPEASIGLVASALASRELAFEDMAAAYNMRGMAFMQLEDFANAQADFSVAVSLEPRFAAALTNRGLARAKLELYADAIADFDRALVIVPGEPEVLFMRANARFDTNDFARAVDDYSLALQTAPEHWMALMNRCDALGKLGRLAEARSDCAKAKPLAPDADVVERVEQALGPCDCKPPGRD